MYAMAKREENRLSVRELEVLRHLRNSIMSTGKSPSIRDIQRSMGYKSPRSVTVILERLIEKGVIRKQSARALAIANEPEKNRFDALTVEVPLVGEVSCGLPLLSEEHIQARIAISTELAIPPHKYFLVRAKGDSMDKAGINDGDLLLVRQQREAKSGDIVVALIDSETTVKYMHIEKEALILRPSSRNSAYTPIIVHRDFVVQGVVIKSLGRVD